MTVVAVVLGGALGALARYGMVSWQLIHWEFGSSGPNVLGTFLVNVVGALALGVIVGLTEARWQLDPALRTGLTVGVLGGFTTFSTLTYEVIDQAESDAFAHASVNLLASVGVGLVAMFVGLRMGRAFA